MWLVDLTVWEGVCKGVSGGATLFHAQRGWGRLGETLRHAFRDLKHPAWLHLSLQHMGLWGTVAFCVDIESREGFY